MKIPLIVCVIECTWTNFGLNGDMIMAPQIVQKGKKNLTENKRTKVSPLMASYCKYFLALYRFHVGNFLSSFRQ